MDGETFRACRAVGKSLFPALGYKIKFIMTRIKYKLTTLGIL